MLHLPLPCLPERFQGVRVWKRGIRVNSVVRRWHLPVPRRTKASQTWASGKPPEPVDSRHSYGPGSALTFSEQSLGRSRLAAGLGSAGAGGGPADEQPHQKGELHPARQRALPFAAQL